MAKEKAAATSELEHFNPATMTADDFDSIQSPEFGGQHPVMVLEVGEVAGPLTYQGRTNMILNNKEIVVHLASNSEDQMVRMPIDSAFLRAMDQAGVHSKDQFAVKRIPDVEKKAGVGKGNMMKMYAIKVLKRFEQPTNGQQ